MQRGSEQNWGIGAHGGESYFGFGRYGAAPAIAANTSDNIGIGLPAPQLIPEKLTVEGNISASGALMGVTHITASGNISGSAISTGSFGNIKGVRDLELGVASSTNGRVVLANDGGAALYKLVNNSGALELTTTSANSRTLALSSETADKTLGLIVQGDISGSATSTGSFGRVQVNQSTFTTAQNTDVDIGTEEIVGFPTGSLTSAFFDYVVSSGSTNQNMRAGTVMSVWNGTNVEHTDTSTNDIGNTTNLKLGVALTSSMAVLRATAASDNWSVKTLVRTI
jgi:hypothetical protein